MYKTDTPMDVQELGSLVRWELRKDEVVVVLFPPFIGPGNVHVADSIQEAYFLLREGNEEEGPGPGHAVICEICRHNPI